MKILGGLKRDINNRTTNINKTHRALYGRCFNKRKTTNKMIYKIVPIPILTWLQIMDIRLKNIISVMEM